MSLACSHGHLARSCEMCESERDLNRMRYALRQIVQLIGMALVEPGVVPRSGDAEWLRACAWLEDAKRTALRALGEVGDKE